MPLLPLVGVGYLKIRHKEGERQQAECDGLGPHNCFVPLFAQEAPAHGQLSTAPAHLAPDCTCLCSLLRCPVGGPLANERVRDGGSCADALRVYTRIETVSTEIFGWRSVLR